MPVTRDPDHLESLHLHDTVNLTDSQVLEIGSGDGRLTSLYEDVVRRTVGIDVAMDALQIAKNLLSNKANFAFADALKLPFRSGSFDVIIYAWSL